MARVRSDLATQPPAARGRWCWRTRSSPAPSRPTPSATSASAASRWCRVTVFDGIDYTALGHLHGQHTLTDQVRYSGSPLAYSFSEAGHRKGSWLVDLGGSGGDRRAGRGARAPAAGPAARLARGVARRPDLRAARSGLGRGDAHRRRSARTGHGSAATTVPAHGGARVRHTGSRLWAHRTLLRPTRAPTARSPSRSCPTCEARLPRPMRSACSTPRSTPAATTATSTCSSAEATDAPAPPGDHRVRAVRSTP